MSFSFKVKNVSFDGEDTVVAGHLISGSIAGTEKVIVPTRSGSSFETVIVGMEVEGPMTMPVPASQGSWIQLALEGTPADRDIPIGCIINSLSVAADHRHRENTEVKWRQRDSFVWYCYACGFIASAIILPLNLFSLAFIIWVAFLADPNLELLPEVLTSIKNLYHPL